MTNEQRQAVEMVGSACSRYEQEAISAVLAEIDRLKRLVEAWRPFVQSFANIVKPDAVSGHHIVRIVCTTECGVEARAALALEKEADHA